MKIKKKIKSVLLLTLSLTFIFPSFVFSTNTTETKLETPQAENTTNEKPKKSVDFPPVETKLETVKETGKETKPAETPKETVKETQAETQKETVSEDPKNVSKENTDGDISLNSQRIEELNEDQIIKTPIETPSSVTGEKYNGSGTVVDFTTTGSKAFYTIKSNDNSVYYLIIDMDKTENNVYFLSEINGEQLTLKDVTQETKKDNTPKPVQTPENNTTKQDPAKGNNFTFWAIIIFGSLAFLGYHLFFGKGKGINPFIKNKDKKTVKKETEDEISDEEVHYSDNSDEEFVEDNE